MNICSLMNCKLLLMTRHYKTMKEILLKLNDLELNVRTPFLKDRLMWETIIGITLSMSQSPNWKQCKTKQSKRGRLCNLSLVIAISTSTTTISAVIYSQFCPLVKSEVCKILDQLTGGQKHTNGKILTKKISK